MLFISVVLVTVTVFFVFWIERRTSSLVQTILKWFPAILFAYVIPAAVTHLAGWDLSHVAMHSWSKNFIIPLAIITVMSALSFRQLRIVGWRPIVVFASGSFTVAIFPIILLYLVHIFAPGLYDLIIDQSFWKGLVPLVGSWIGGSTSLLVLKEVVECPEDLFLAILVVDNVLVNIWTILMFQLIQRSDGVNRFFKINDEIPDFVPDEIDTSVRNRSHIIITIFTCLFLALGSYFLPGSFVVKILLLSALGLLLGNLVKMWDHASVLKLGGILIVIVMAILGLKLNFGNIHLPLSILGFIVIWLLAHYIVMTSVARILRLHMAWVPIASMANVGGISTAPAVTKAYNEEWMPHAILLAILSMVSGTTWGLLTIFLFESLFGV